MTSAFASATDELVTLLGPTARSAPPRSSTETGIDVTLVGIAATTPIRLPDRRRQPVRLEHLVSFAGPPPDAADHLHDAWLALSGAGHLDVATEPLAPEWWLAFGVVPRPALLVRATVPVDEVLDAGPPVERHVVRHHREVDTAGARAWAEVQR